VVLLIDQASKFYIKTHFEYNEDVAIAGLDWARLHFVENEGMAFGITFDWVYGKLLLSMFRVLMVLGLVWYLRLLLQEGVPFGFTLSIALITAGALGNILDSAFYALIFSNSAYHGGVATLVPFGQGYGMEQGLPLGGFMHGKVVDMLYFPMKWVSVPEWVPYFGGGEYLFFSWIFNVADAAITCGVLSIILFQRSFFKHGMVEQAPAATTTSAYTWEDAEKADLDSEPDAPANATSDNDGPQADVEQEPLPEEDVPANDAPFSDQPSESAPNPNKHNLL
jgi:signal peptidase II